MAQPRFARRPAAPLLLPALLGLLAAALPAGAWDAPPPPVPAAWVAIATVEHVRGDPAGLDPFLAADADPQARRRAIVALGRLGDREGVAARLRSLLRRGGADAPTALWAAGLSGAKALVPDVLPYLGGDAEAKAGTVVAAVEALGSLGDERADGYLLPLARAKDASVAAASLLALARLGAERDLEAVAARLDEADPTVRRAAAAATGRLAGPRRKARSKPDDPWRGDHALAEAVVGAMAATTDAETRLFGMRALNALTPKVLERPDAASKKAPPDLVLLDGAHDPDPRVAADVAFRLGAAHAGPDVEQALGLAGAHADPLVRQTAVEALGTLGTPGAAKTLRALTEAEKDPRVREAAAIALAACGDDDGSRALLARSDRPADPLARALTDVRAALASKGEEAVTRLLARLSREPTSLPPAALAEWIGGLADRPPAQGAGAKAPDPLGEAAATRLRDPDPAVRAATVAYVAKRRGAAGLPEILRTYADSPGRPMVDARLACVSALEDMAKSLAGAPPGREGGPDDAVRRQVREAIEGMARDEAPTVRLAARQAAAALPETPTLAKAEDPRPNEWRGLPRPKAPVLGLDLTKGDPWLSEEEVLRVAERVRATGARVVLETDVGEIRLALDAEGAPVHAANLVLCALAGVYDGTPWHRVVPAFVIQGGDPRGDGSGDAGYAIPDEITPARFERGALGMPKSTKDTGGCQVFVMHVWAPHLDGNYTCYGRVESGLDAVDRVRVGDRIRKARVEATVR